MPCKLQLSFCDAAHQAQIPTFRTNFDPKRHFPTFWGRRGIKDKTLKTSTLVSLGKLIYPSVCKYISIHTKYGIEGASVFRCGHLGDHLSASKILYPLFTYWIKRLKLAWSVEDICNLVQRNFEKIGKMALDALTIFELSVQFKLAIWVPSFSEITEYKKRQSLVGDVRWIRFCFHVCSYLT